MDEMELGQWCKEPDCGRPRDSRGWCSRHYWRWWANGTAELRPRRHDPVQWFWDHISPEPNTGCWLWTGGMDGKGYAAMPSQGRAGRYSLEIHGVPVPPGMCVCHRCDNPPCVNPAHLYVGTRADNNRDTAARGRARFWGRPATGVAHAG